MVDITAQREPSYANWKWGRQHGTCSRNDRQWSLEDEKDTEITLSPCEDIYKNIITLRKAL